MQSYWVSVTYDAEAVSMMLDYLSLEFDLPRDASVRVKHH